MPNSPCPKSCKDWRIVPTGKVAVARKLFGTKNGTHTVTADATHADKWSECSYGKLSLARNKDNALSPGFSSDFPGDANDVFYVDVPLQCTAGSGLCTGTYNLTAACGPDEYYGFPKWAFAYLTANVPGFTKSTWQHWVIIFDNSPMFATLWAWGTPTAAVPIVTRGFPIPMQTKHRITCTKWA